MRGNMIVQLLRMSSKQNLLLLQGTGVPPVDIYSASF
jgi:hypothetical protein